MKIAKLFRFTGILVWLSLTYSVAAHETPGEFEICDVRLISPVDLKRLRTFADQSPGAQSYARKIQAAVLPYLNVSPRPLQVIYYEGLVNTDPRRIDTVDKLKEMDDVAAILRYWQLGEDETAVQMLQNFTVSWAGTYLPRQAFELFDKSTVFQPEWAALARKLSPEPEATFYSWNAYLTANIRRNE